MKNTFATLLVILAFIFLAGCGQNQPQKTTTSVYGFSFIEGKVIGKIGNKVIVEIVNKDIVEGNLYIDKLANAIMKNSLFVTGMQTSIENEEGTIVDIRGKQLTFTLDDTKLQDGQIVKIYIPKKTIAVVDFSLIGIDNKTLDKFAMEDMTTKLVQSGQYLVVERTKLNSILEEHKLTDSGLLDDKSSLQLGKLLSADIILTGTFSKRGSNWIANLRLVDVKTGVILTAINETISGNEFRWQQEKDTSNLTESFENNTLGLGWNINVVNANRSSSIGKIDNTTGANGTAHSYQIEYKFDGGNGAFEFQNKRLRDISAYKGISFYAKADKTATIRACLKDKNFNDSSENKWVTPINLGMNWKKYEVSFDELSIGTKYAIQFKGGDGNLDLDNIVKIMIEMRAKENGVNHSEGKGWIDEITLY
ncbi:MAG: FlgO family outer membrane protein [Arcobacteraceae bacterium]|jgi:TolB-like protein|nr:FlgO family outer membrane protein [Arcobacteraceae bacterium]